MFGESRGECGNECVVLGRVGEFCAELCEQGVRPVR